MESLHQIVKEQLVSDDPDEPFQMTASDYFDETKGMWAIDAWHDPDADDDGYTAAYVDPDTYEVVYMTDEAAESNLVKEEIELLVADLEKKKNESDAE